MLKGHRAHEFSIDRELRASVEGKADLALSLRGRVSLARRLYTGQNPNAQEHDATYCNPAAGHVRQMRPIHQPADQDGKPYGVDSE
jgi:hypothetical protein